MLLSCEDPEAPYTWGNPPVSQECNPLDTLESQSLESQSLESPKLLNDGDKAISNFSDFWMPDNSSEEPLLTPEITPECDSRPTYGLPPSPTISMSFGVQDRFAAIHRTLMYDISCSTSIEAPCLDPTDPPIGSSGQWLKDLSVEYECADEDMQVDNSSALLIDTFPVR